MQKLMIETHEVWLEMLMAGFMSQGKNKQILFDFSDILFRHFTWLEDGHIATDLAYSYDRSAIPIKVEKLHDIIKDIERRLLSIESVLLELADRELATRMQSDIKYIKSLLASLPDETITAFDMERQYQDISLTEEARDALTLFLFEETYKEYELIMIYNYLKAHSQDAYMNRIFQILIDESFFHFKSFGDMAAEMGILAVPRMIMKELYQIEDVVKFLKDGINEEIAAKEECQRLADAVAKDSSELARFFDFINYQENYHIALMRDALAHYTGEKNV